MRLILFVALLLAALPAAVLSAPEELVALRTEIARLQRQVQELEADLVRVKADAYDRIRKTEETIRQANAAILEGVQLAKANGDSTLIAGLKKAGYPI